MYDIAKLGEKVEELRSEILELAEVPELDDAQEARWTAANTEFDTATAELKVAEERAAKVAAVRETVVNKPEQVRTERTGPEVIIKRDAFEALETRYTNPAEQRQAFIDGNLRALEGKLEGREAEVHVEKLLNKHADDTNWAADLLQRSMPAYGTGFIKAITGREHSISPEERTALSTLTNANGKFAVPTHLDSSLIVTNAGTSNNIRPASRVETLTVGNVWNGLSSAGVTASFDTELSEVSDDSPTYSQPSITTYTARAFVQASIQSVQDINGLEGQLYMLFADAKDRLEGLKHALGSGSGEPFGIFTAIDATSASEVTSTTAAAIGAVDLDAMYYGLPVRHRGNAKWLTNPRWALAIKALGTAVSSNYSGDLRDAPTGLIYDHPVIQSDDAPAVTTTTALDQRVIFGDFRNYVIVDMPGSMVVEYIPHLFNTTTNLPDGRRGWFAYWRTGADSVNDDAFRLLLDKTSA